jgi:Fe-coproporphyrin III synthase
MSTLLSISVSDDSLAVAAHQIRTLPVLVIFPHNQCNCRCVMCDIWRIREAKQITPADLEKQLSAFRKLGVRWVVLSGGEPQLNGKWSSLAQMLRLAGTRVTLLTAGLLLKSQAQVVVDCIDDVIVSLDGCPVIHNKIRRIPTAFEQMSDGVRALRQFRPDMPVRARCTVQKANHRSLRAVVRSAKDIGLNSISFLAADVTSTAFNHMQGSTDRSRIALDTVEVGELESEIESLITEHAADVDSGFVVESAGKLRRIVSHFRAQLGMTEAVAPRCNAPWVSAVVEASGDVRPCFFHPVFGNIHRQTLHEIVNGPPALQFRQNLDIATNPVCRQCVCSLYLPLESE